ncbi:MAG TPA: FAD-dependent oxidoreductase [Paracoccaceae bacterium]|mgnify:CR=1 FL=1|nr:FAD-dependent oxidoreductase [Paracoccaceae bacterium]
MPRPPAPRALQTTDVAVIGAGVIGLTAALELARRGRSVLLIDPGAPGSGASHGNAGTIADYAVAPVGTPDVLRDLPMLLFNRDSPFALHRPSLPALLPWLARFVRASLPCASARNAATLAALLTDAGALWADLAASIGVTREMRDSGCLYLYATEAEGNAAEAGLARRRALGVRAERLSPDALAALEPGLPTMAGGAAFFPGVRWLTDPGAVMARLAAACTAAGVQTVAARIDRIERAATGIVLKGHGFLRTARAAVIAAGAHSARLAAQAGVRVPLTAERGYHLEWDMSAPLVTRPACPVARGFYLCPMAGRLRVAGTVELGGIDAPPSPHRLAALERGARALFPDLPPPDRSWMGLRPSVPDSLPVIGPAGPGREVILAFGHGHIGLTLAPLTARAVADLLAGRDPGDRLAACSPGRF